MGGVVEWRKASHSGNGGADCVELAALGGEQVGIRDSKDPEGPWLTFSRAALRMLATELKNR